MSTTRIAYLWALDRIAVEIEDAEGAEVMVQIDTPVGRIVILGQVALADGVLTIDRAPVGGLSPGRLGRAGLNAIGRKILEETGAEALVIQGSSRTSGRNPGRAPAPIRYPRGPGPVRR